MNTRLPFVARLVLPMVALLIAAPAMGAPAPKTVAEALQEEQALVVKAGKLTDAQQESLKEKYKLKQAALEAWEKANGEKAKAAKDAAAAARKAGDPAAGRKAGEELKALMAERDLAAAEADKAIQALLSEDQKASLAGAKLAEAMLPRLKKANLTDEQAGRVRAACVAAARDLASITGEDKKDKQAKQTIEKSLKWAIENVVMTPEQKALVGPKPKPAAPAPAPAAPAPAAPAPAPAPAAPAPK